MMNFNRLKLDLPREPKATQGECTLHFNRLKSISVAALEIQRIHIKQCRYFARVGLLYVLLSGRDR